MTHQDIARLRLYNQQIARPQFKAPGQVVSWLGALQAQDYAGAKWSIGLRLPDTTDADLEQSIATKAIIRTWLMRGTLHFVEASDVHWMLALLTPRVIAGSARRRQQLELDDSVFARSRELFVKGLRGGKQLTRNEMYLLLERANISTAGQRGYHILVQCAQEGLICFGPPVSNQQTFTLLEEWAPRTKKLERDEALAELTRRYFTSHGPATQQDFVWWSGLTVTEARAGLDMAKSQLRQETVGDQTYWMPLDMPVVEHNEPAGYLLPGFDEYLLGYKDRTAAFDPIHSRKINPGNNGMLNPTLVIDGRVIGTWKRTFKKDRVVITVSPFTSLTEAHSRAISAAVEPYGRFVARSTVVIL